MSNRQVYDTSRLSNWRYVAGLDIKAVTALAIVLGMMALMMRAPIVLLPLLITVGLLYKEGRKDQEFLRVLIKHFHQKDRYSPANRHAANMRNPRPHGFNRLEVL
jgi:hypothetical protein